MLYSGELIFFLNLVVVNSHHTHRHTHTFTHMCMHTHVYTPPYMQGIISKKSKF